MWEKNILTFTWYHTKISSRWIADLEAKGKIKLAGFILSDTNMYYKVTVIKIMWYRHKNDQINQWKREYPKTRPHIQGILIYDKGNIVVQRGKDGLFRKCQVRTSLVAQRLRICLPMQGTRVQALVWEDPTCLGATKPVHHNYWACALEPASHNYWAHVPQLLKPVRPEPVLHNKRSHHKEKPAHRNEE